MLKEELIYRELPELLKLKNGETVNAENWRVRRAELLDILCKNIYGYTPAAPDRVDWKIIENDNNAYAGKVIQQKINVAFETPKGKFDFNFDLFIPKSVESPPAFVHIAFRPDLPDRYSPIEEITDNGFAFALFCYNDIVMDSLDGNYDQGLAGMYHKENTAREPYEWGKIGMWAFAASRVLDCLTELGTVNASRAAVIGHSRLGKTALWAAAQDERFFMAVSNDSGFGGAAIAKKGSGERVSDFIRCRSWDWFCETFKTYLGKEDENEVYDQHMLLSLIAPRYMCIGSAELDKGADPHSEFLSALSASTVYELLGYDGLITPDCYPEAPSSLNDGRIHYHIRKGTHFFSRTDWIEYMNYFNRIMKS